MFKKVLASLVLFISIFLNINCSMVVNAASPADDNYGLGSSGVQTSFGTSDVPTIIGRVIQIVMGLSASVMLVMIVWAGIQYMISRGDGKKQQAAIKMITSTAIGIVIIVAAYAISNFIINNIKFLAS